MYRRAETSTLGNTWNRDSAYKQYYVHFDTDDSGFYFTVPIAVVVVVPKPQNKQ